LLLNARAAESSKEQYQISRLYHKLDRFRKQIKIIYNNEKVLLAKRVDK
jgi:hypothetical protein